MKYVAGIDIGTSSCKTVIVDAEGMVIAEQSQDYFAKVDGFAADMDPMDWWKAAAATLNAACGEAKIPTGDIVAVGCSGQMQGCTFIGKDGKPSRDSKLWYDLAPTEESRQLDERYGDLFRKHACMPSVPSLTGSKIKWVMNHQPNVWAKTDKFIFASSFITYMLTGVLAVDRSNLGLSGLNDVCSDSWSSELMDATGVTPDKVPDLLDSMDIAGKVTAEAAAFTGLREGTPVIAGCGDGPGECFSVNIANRSEIKLRLGSAADVKAVVPLEWLGTKADAATPYVTPGLIGVGNYTKGCALSIAWVRDVFFSELPKDSASFGIMDAEAASVPLGSGGIIYHPYLNGENAPYFDADLRAKFTGIHSSARRGDFLRAAYEGVSFSIRDLVEKDPALRLLDKMVICGGGAKSSLWLSILSDVLGRSGIVPRSADAAFGVALMAGQAAGLFDAAKAADNSRDSGKSVSCDMDNHEKYEPIFQRYLSLART